MKRRATKCVTHTTHNEYAAIDAVNWSTLRAALDSALAYSHRLANPPAETDAMRLGRATHTAVFEPDRLLHEYVIWTGGRRQGNEWEQFKAMHAAQTILRPDEYDCAVAIRDAVRGHKPAAALLRSGMAECTLTWTDEETGLACKARLDWLSDKVLADLKTTRSIDGREFGRHAAAMRYHGQFGFACMGLRANGIEVPVKIIAVENEPPHDVCVFHLDEEVLWAGEDKARAALDLVAECRKRRRWPGRYTEEQKLVLPPWEYPGIDDESLGLVIGGVSR